MTGGMIFEANGVKLQDEQGRTVTCPRCCYTRFDIRIKGDEPDRIECSAADCGMPLTADAVDQVAGPGS